MLHRNIAINLFVIPLSLFIFSCSIFILLIVVNDQRFFSVLLPSSKNHILTNTPFEISGRIPVKPGKVGTVIVNFKNSTQSRGSVLFTVKEMRTRRIIYQNTYPVSYIAYLKSFPFGFPLIEQEKNSDFVFYISPLDPHEKLNISLSQGRIPYEVLYQFERSELIQSSAFFKTFLKGKLQQYTSHLFRPQLFFYLLIPDFIYYFFYVINHKLINIFIPKINSRILRFEKPSFIFVIATMYYSSFQDKSLHSLLLISISLFWTVLLVSYKKKSRDSYLISLCFLLLCPLLIISDYPQTAANFASWSFILIFIGAAQEMITLEKLGLNFPRILHMDKQVERLGKALYLSIAKDY